MRLVPYFYRRAGAGIRLQIDHDTGGRFSFFLFQQPGIALRGFHMTVPEHFGYGINIGTMIQLQRRVGMPEASKSQVFVNACPRRPFG